MLLVHKALVDAIYGLLAVYIHLPIPGLRVDGNLLREVHMRLKPVPVGGEGNPHHIIRDDFGSVCQRAQFNRGLPLLLGVVGIEFG